MRKGLFLVTLIVISVLAVSLVTAAWPFESLTGAVTDNTLIDDSDFNLCSDSDGGIFSTIPGVVTYKGLIGPEKEAKDTCRSEDKLLEHYCKAPNGKMTRAQITCKFGCVEDGDGVGACVVPEPSCEEVENGVKNERGVLFRNRCRGRTYYSYSCDGTDVSETTTECPNICSVSQGGCAGICSSETDSLNDKDTPGSVDVDGKTVLDKCHGSNRVKQYACEDSKLKPLSTEDCGRNRECVDDDNGAYCRDIVAGTQTIADLTKQIADLQEIIDELLDRVSALEAIVNP